MAYHNITELASLDFVEHLDLQQCFFTFKCTFFRKNTFFKLENPEECKFFEHLEKFPLINHRNHYRNKQKSEKEPKNSKISASGGPTKEKSIKTFNLNLITKKFYILQKQIKKHCLIKKCFIASTPSTSTKHFATPLDNHQ